MIVFDRAYNHYLQFANFTQNQIDFVCRLKSNAITIPNKENPNVDLKALEDYLNSLNLLVEDYEKTHSK